MASGSPALALYDKDTNLRAMLGVDGDGAPSLDLRDKDMKVRATFDESTLTLFDAKGGVLWQEPRFGR